MFFKKHLPDKLEQYKISEQNEENNSFRISVLHEHVEVARAICDVRKDDIYLRWIETDSEHSGKGIGTKILNYLCDKISIARKNLVINVVDEQILDGFYLSWLKKRFDPNQCAKEEFIEFFNSIVTLGEHNPLLKLSDKDLFWTPKVSSVSPNTIR